MRLLRVAGNIAGMIPHEHIRPQLTKQHKRLEASGQVVSEQKASKENPAMTTSLERSTDSALLLTPNCNIEAVKGSKPPSRSKTLA